LNELRKALSEPTLVDKDDSLPNDGQNLLESNLPEVENGNEDPNASHTNDLEKNEVTKETKISSEEISEIETRLYSLFSKKQELLSSIATVTCSKLVPLRETLQNLQKQLHYVRSDTATDKSVCEVSGNFMSSRDADERIAAHYAGKQYVGWTLVREKLKELQKKYPGGYSQIGQHGHNVSAPPSHGGQWAHPPPGYEQVQRGPPPDYNSHRDRQRGQNFPQPPVSNHGRMSGNRRGSSPERWERDRGMSGDDRRSYGYHRSNR
jgi:hypothetical protein